MSNKKVAIIGTNGIPARYGGFETLAENLVKELNQDFDFIVYCSNIYKKEQRLKTLHGAKLIYVPLKANGIQSLFYDLITTFHSLFKADIFLILGPAAGFMVPFMRIFKKKVIVNHGGLNEWEREKLSLLEQKYVYFNHKWAAQYANYNIADNIPLGESLKKSFGVSSEIIAYGGDHVVISPRNEELRIKYPFLELSYDLSISRAQEDNNLHILLKAYADHPNRNLVLISNWNISEYGKKLKTTYFKKFQNIFVVDAIYDLQILNIIRSNTSLYIHSHSRCGTAPSLVEAMNYKIPIICFDVETNRLTTNNSSIYFKDVDSLSSLLSNLNESELKKNKQDLDELARNNYTWQNIADKYSKLFTKL